jgi:hypothetical protein
MANDEPPRSRKKGARSRDSGSNEAPADKSAKSDSSDPSDVRGKPIPDLLRRAVALGLSGFFTTEEAFRRALGDTVPKEWVDFASEQGERARRDFADSMAQEVGRVMENVDLTELITAILEKHTLEVEATIRLRPRDSSTADTRVRLRVAPNKESRDR